MWQALWLTRIDVDLTKEEIGALAHNKIMKMNVGSHQLGGTWQGNKAVACLRNGEFHLKAVAL